MYIEGTEETDLRAVLRAAARPDCELESLLLSDEDYAAVLDEYAEYIEEDGDNRLLRFGTSGDYALDRVWIISATQAKFPDVYPSTPLLRLRCDDEYVDMALIYFVLNADRSFDAIWNMIVDMLGSGAPATQVCLEHGFRRFVRRQGTPQGMWFSLGKDGYAITPHTIWQYRKEVA